MEYLVIIVVVVAIIDLCLMLWLMHKINKDSKKEQFLLETLITIVQKNK